MGRVDAGDYAAVAGDYDIFVVDGEASWRVAGTFSDADWGIPETECFELV